MKIADVLRRAGVQFEEWGIDRFKGYTPGGKGWTMERAAGAYGLKFTLRMEGMNTATACLLRTAIQKIKKN